MVGVGVLSGSRHLRRVLSEPAYVESSERMHVDLALQFARSAGEHQTIWGPAAAFTRRRTALDSYLRFEYQRAKDAADREAAID